MRWPLIAKVVGTLSLSIVGGVAFAKPINLKWKKIEGAKAYNYEVASKDDFSQILVKKTVATPGQAQELKSGIYFLRVQTVSARGKTGRWSKPFRLVVTAPIEAPKAEEKRMAYVSEAPNVESAWDATDVVTGYKVIIEKDGAVYNTYETKSPKVDFKPQEPGSYVVKVSAGYSQWYGPATVVKRIKIVKTKLAQAQWQMDESGVFSSREPVGLKWQEVEGAERYKLVVLRLATDTKMKSGDRNLASKTDDAHNGVIASETTVESDFILEPLPPGRYVASVEAEEKTSVGPQSKYYFEIQKKRVIQFERIDLSFKYNISGISNESTVVEAQNSIRSVKNTIGGVASVEGNLRFADSNWGLKTYGSWGGYNVASKSITFSDMLLAASYKFSVLPQSTNARITPYLGARAWTVPVLLPPTSSSGGSTSTEFIVFNPMLFGGAAGLDYLHPFSSRLAFTAKAQVAVPFTSSSVGGGDISQIKAKQDSSFKAEAGFKYVLPGGTRLLASAGYSYDVFSWTPVAGSSGNSSSTRTGTSKSTLTYPYLGLGIEVSDDPDGFGAATIGSTKTAKRSWFSEFDFSAHYNFLSTLYDSSYKDGLATSSQSNSIPSEQSMVGSLQLEMEGWFQESVWGLRGAADLGGITAGGATISYPQFIAEAGMRPSLFGRESSWRLSNYFGARAWTVPVLYRGGSGSSDIFSSLPMLIGPVETLVLAKKFGLNWIAQLSGQVSMPLYMANKTSAMDKLYTNLLSYEAKFEIIHNLSDEFALGAGVIHKVDQVRYGIRNMPESITTRATVSGSGATIQAIYSF